MLKVYCTNCIGPEPTATATNTGEGKIRVVCESCGLDKVVPILVDFGDDITNETVMQGKQFVFQNIERNGGE